MDYSQTSFWSLASFSETGWGWAFVQGAWLTVRISLASYLLGIILGLLGARAKLGGNRTLYWLAEGYTTLIRAIPTLLLIIVLYYTGTRFFDATLNVLGLAGAMTLNGFAAVVFCLGFILGAYMTEVFRGAIQALPPGMDEAARSLALSPVQRFRLVTFPLMMRLALPGLNNLWQSTLKDSSLVSVVGFAELLATGKMVAGETRMYLTFYLFVAVIFLALTLSSNLVFALVARRLDRGFR
jgi:polar amino acid transport system permease protein